MGSKKTSTQTNTFAYQTPPDTPDIQAARATPVNTDLLNSALDRQYGLADQELSHRYNSAFMSGMPQSLRNAQYNEAKRGLMYDKATAKAMGQYNVNQQLLGKNLAVAGMTAPQLTQTGGTTVEKYNPGFWGALGALGQFAGGVGTAALGFKS